MLEFQLFRLKVFPTRQGDLFRNEMTRAEVLAAVIRSVPEVELREGSVWHIGNVSDVEETALYFRLGRTTKSTVERYKDGNFVDEPFEAAPYTHVIVDLELEVSAIARKPRLSPRANAIADAFARLLNESQEGARLNAKFEIGEMADPEEFIAQLASAYNVSKFWVAFSKPNPFDVNQDFVRPMQKLLSDSDGDQGKTELKGTALRPEVLQDVARSAAATGDNAGATMQLDQAGQRVKKTLRQNPVVITQEDVTETEDKKTLLRRMREVYRRIRGRDER